MDVQGLAQMMVMGPVGKKKKKNIHFFCLTLAYILPTKRYRHAKGICSQLQDKRPFSVHIVLLCRLLH